MKTIHLNLASRPYRDFRVPYALLGGAALAALVLMGYNVVTAFRYLVDTKSTRQEIAALEGETKRERETADSMERRIASIDAVSLERQAKYINSQIRERTFSWSTMISRLEGLLPGEVRLTSLNPSVDEEGNVELTLECVSRRHDGMIVLLDRLYTNPAFKNAFPSADTAQPDGTHNLTVQTTYLPAAVEVKK